jgi:hypothetical protein
MTDQHPIIPPSYLVQQWRHSWLPSHGEFVDYVATQASQWGADQELEACCEWLVSEGWFKYEHKVVEDLRAARRPKPPSLKEQALTALYAIATGANDTREQHQDFDTIRKALEQLDD